MSDPTDTAGPCSDERPLVGIVVLTWENYAEARDCLASLRTISYPNYEVFVVDNGSQDGSYEQLRREFECCKFVRNEENLGVTRGNNAGIKRALDADVDYVLLLNDDTVVKADFLLPLVRTAENRPDAAVVGGVNYHASTGEIHNAGARFLTLLGGRTVLYDEPRADEPYPVDYIPTCLALIDAAFAANRDVLSEAYFLGMEDVDLAWQARAAGKKVLVNPDSAINHRLGTTSSRSSFSVYHRVRNRLTFAARHLSPARRAVFLFVLCLWTLASGLWWVARSDWGRARAAMLGVLDYTTDRDFRSHDDLA